MAYLLGPKTKLVFGHYCELQTKIGAFKSTLTILPQQKIHMKKQAVNLGLRECKLLARFARSFNTGCGVLCIDALHEVLRQIGFLHFPWPVVIY